jgi:hypothetical protein
MELCFTKIGIQWRSFKYATKLKYYYKFKTDEQRLACEPPQVDPNQWKELVKHWGQEEAKVPFLIELLLILNFSEGKSRNI